MTRTMTHAMARGVGIAAAGRARTATAIAAAVMLAAPTLAGAAVAPPVEPAHIVLIGPPETGAGAELAGRVVDLLRDALPGGIYVESADAFVPEELFGLDRSDAGRPTAWAVVGETIVRLRAAGAGRERFVFRDLVVSHPLTELDRERVGQMLKVALVAVIEGGPGVIGRRDAQVALGIAAAPVAVVPRQEVRAPDAAPVVAPTPARAVRFALGGFYKIQHTGLGFSHGPGIVATLEWVRPRVRPGGWLILQYDLPQEMSDGINSLPLKHGPAFRAGLSLAPASWVHVDVGGGIDFEHLSREHTWTVESTYFPGLVPVLRLATRLGPAPLSAFRVSATASVEIARLTVPAYQLVSSPPSLIGGGHSLDTRPGLALEIWWL